MTAAPHWRIDADGWLDAARRMPSPHFDERPPGTEVTLAVIHAISLPPGKFGDHWVERFFLGDLDPTADDYFREIHALRVSAHFYIRRGGELIQFVSSGCRAWHAGASTWQGRSRCNDFSIGIELEGCDDCAFEPAQYRVLATLLAALRRELPLRDIAGHAEIAPGRKTDPGPHFDWRRLRAMLARRERSGMPTANSK